MFNTGSNKYQIQIIKLHYGITDNSPRAFASVQKIYLVCIMTVYRIIKGFFLASCDIASIFALNRRNFSDNILFILSHDIVLFFCKSIQKISYYLINKNISPYKID